MNFEDTLLWTAFGLAGQAAFFSRFLVQWIASERRGESVVPVAFWYLSLAGAAMLLVYATHRQEPIFMLGQSVGAFVYIRNLVLVRRQREAAAVGTGRGE